MSEIIETTSTIEQPKAETIVKTDADKTLERLSAQYPDGEPVKSFDPPKTDPVNPETPAVVEPTAEELDALKTKAKELGLEETATKTEIEAAEKAKADTEWKIDEVVKSPEEENDGTWKGLIETFELGDLPADYSEEKGFEVVQDLFNKKLEAAKSEALSEAKFDRYSDVPEEHRAQTEMYVELMKTGLTMEKINEPFIELAQIKAMDKEGLVRFRLEGQQGWDAEMVDAQMQKIIEGGTIEVEYKIAKAQLDSYEQSLQGQQKQQIEQFKNSQKQIQEQRVNQENLKLKVALDRVPEFLGKKLPDNLKSQLAGELQTDAYRNMAGTPEEKVDYFLYRKFGKTAMANFKDRALERVVVEHKQDIHNVPLKEHGDGNRVEATSTLTEAEQRLNQQYGTPK